MFDFKLSLEYILTSMGLFALWGIRHEYLAKANSKDISLLDHDVEHLRIEIKKEIQAVENKQSAFESKVAIELNEIKSVLVRIETILEYMEKQATKGE